MADFQTEPGRLAGRKVPPLPIPESAGSELTPDSTPSAPADEAVTAVSLQTESDEDQPEIGPVIAVLTSAATVSFFSSATFHLLTLGAVIVISPLLGLDWLKLDEEPQTPLMAALGDEDITDDLAQFEMIGDLSDQFEKPATSMEQLAKELQRSDSGSMLMAQDDVLKSLAGSDANEPEEDGGGVLLKVPESGLAVTKGSFTAFTIPANPKPREIYSIVIEIRLPDDVKKFRVNDLVGEVKGSDGYRQKIPYDSRAAGAAGYPAENQKVLVLDSSTVLDVVKNRVQIIIRVPGAARLVKDEIRIRSRKLKEEQELTLVFGVPSNQTTDNADDNKEQPEE